MWKNKKFDGILYKGSYVYKGQTRVFVLNWVQAISFKLTEIAANMKEDDFQRDFFESLQEQFERKEWLSEKQLLSLDRIYERVTDV